MASARVKDAIFFGGLILSYTLGVAFLRLFEKRPRTPNALTTADALAVSLGVLFSTTDVLAANFVSRYPMFLVAMGFGALNVFVADVSGTPCGVVTGHIQKLGGSLADASAELSPTQKIATAASTSIVCCFVSGIIAGCFGRTISLPHVALCRIPFTTLSVLIGALIVWHDRPPFRP